MANSRILPSASAPLSDPRGLATPQFYRFFQALSELDVNSASQADIATLQSEIAAIQDEINALPPAQGYPDLQVSAPLFSQGLLKNGFALIGVNTLNSVVVNGNALQLDGDALAPGNTFLYSTGLTGTKGWNALSSMLHQTANILLTTGADGTVTFTLGGAAAGDLSGTYPNPTVAKVNGTALGATSATAGEVLLGTGTAIASTPISGDATLSGTGALTLAASGVTAGNYGDATHTATFTVDAKGRLTLAGTSAIAFPVTSVFGRTGAVAAVANDYAFNQINGLIIPQGYIDGLQMVWNSATSISVTSGTAYIPSLANVLASNSTLTLSGLTLTASTWYHVYLYSNAGVPAIECVTTAPVLYYGTAYQKTGANTRRYIGSVRTQSSGGTIINFDHSISDGSIMYKSNINNDGLLVLNTGAATTNTIVDCSATIPVTGTRIYAFFDNSGASLVYVSSADLPAVATIMFYIRQAPTGSRLQIKSYVNLYNQSLAYQNLVAPGAGLGLSIYNTGYIYAR